MMPMMVEYLGTLLHFCNSFFMSLDMLLPLGKATRCPCAVFVCKHQCPDKTASKSIQLCLFPAIRPCQPRQFIDDDLFLPPLVVVLASFWPLVLPSSLVCSRKKAWLALRVTAILVKMYDLLSFASSIFINCPFCSFWTQCAPRAVAINPS